MTHKIILSLLMSVGVSCLLVAEESGSRFALETHSVNTIRGEMPVTFKLDTTTGDVWRYSGADFVQIPVAGTWSSSVDKRPENLSQREIILKRMENIIIPELEFRQANIYDVFDFLRAASIPFDNSKTGVNIIMNLGNMEKDIDSSEDPFAESTSDDDTEVPLITFSARDISLLEALKIVTKVSNLAFRIDDGAVMVVPFYGYEGEIGCRIYDLLPSTMAKISSYDEGLFKTNLSPSLVASNWKEFFSEKGINWPSYGSSINVHPLIGKLIIYNTNANLDLLEGILQGINSYPPRTGRFRLSSMNMNSTPAVLIIDSDIGHTWQYEISKFDGVKREIVTDTFTSIPVRLRRNE